MASLNSPLRSALRRHRLCPRQRHAAAETPSLSRTAAVTPVSSSRPSSALYVVPSVSSYLSLYHRLLRVSGRFDDDVVRHWLRVHLRFAFRSHRQQHLTRHGRESHRKQEREAAQQWVKERIRCLVHSQPLPAPFVSAPSDVPSPSAVSIIPSTPSVSYDLRRLLHVRYKSAMDFLRRLQLAEDGNRLARIRLLSLAYGFAGPVMGLMAEARSRMLVDPPWWEETQRTYPLHPMQEAAVRIGLMGSGGGGEREVEWTAAYRLMVLDRCGTMDREWRRAFKSVLQLNQVPQQGDVRKQWEADGEQDSEETRVDPAQLEDEERQPSYGGWVEWPRSAQRRLALLTSEQKRKQAAEPPEPSAAQ